MGKINPIAFNHRQFGNLGHGNTETAMPFPYPKLSSPDRTHRQFGNFGKRQYGDGNAVSLPQMLDQAIRFNHHPIRRETALPSPHSGSWVKLTRSHLIIDNMVISETAMPCPYPKLSSPDRTHRQFGNLGHGNTETAMPFPYPKLSSPDRTHRQFGTRQYGYGNAVSLPPNARSGDWI